MVDISSTISITKLNVNHPNTAIQRHRLSENISKIKNNTDQNICYLQETRLNINR